MAEDGIAVVKFQMLVEPDAGVGLSDDRCQRGLADLQWFASLLSSIRSNAYRKNDLVMTVVTGARNEPSRQGTRQHTRR